MELVLIKHKLNHIPKLKVGDNLFSSKFSSICSQQNCNGLCCRLGVFVDINERDNILRYANLIQRHMQPHQEHDPKGWFEENEFTDPDFPSGRTIGTRVKDYGCVFLDKSGKCTLQKACINEGLNEYLLKPFYCTSYPITIDNGTIMIDDTELENCLPCCIIDPKGELNVFDVCSKELEFVLGKEGYEELINIFQNL